MASHYCVYQIFGSDNSKILCMTGTYEQCQDFIRKNLGWGNYIIK